MASANFNDDKAACTETRALASTGVPCAVNATARRWPPGLVNELKFRILHFTPSWFAANMGTGISSVLIHKYPFEFRGQQTIALVIFGLNVVMFIMFSLATCIRYAVWPSIFRLMLEHSVQSLFLGTFAMGFATIVNMISTLSPKTIMLAWGLWWFDVAVSILIAVGVPFLMFTKHKHDVPTITGMWLLPIVSLIVAAATGAVVAEHLDPTRARLTAQFCYVILGAGLLPALLVQALYLQRLTIHKLPPAAVVVSVFLPLGPCGQSAFALMQLARVDAALFAATGHGLLPGGQMASTAVGALSTLAAFMIWGLGAWWFALALLTIGHATMHGGFAFNMGWWGFTFPLGTMASAANAFGSELDSFAWRVIGAVLSGAVVVLWAYVATRTAVEAVRGTVFSAPCLGPSGMPPPKRKGDQTPQSISDDGAASSNTNA